MTRQIATLRRAVQRLVAAEIANSWKGAGYVEDIKPIERELAVARKRYESALGALNTLIADIKTGL